MGVLQGDFADRRITNGGTPTIAAAATTAVVLTTSSISGNDEAGVITLKTGTTPTTGSMVTVTFGSNYTSAPQNVVVGRNDTVNDAVLYGATSIGTSSFVLRAYAAPTASSTYSVAYKVNA